MAAKHVKILGPGCPKCKQLYANVSEALKAMNMDCEVEKITDVQEIIKYGVMMTPALVVDEDVKISGKVASIEEIKRVLS